MWSSIQNIEHPISLGEASKLNDGKHRVLFSGGTYLAAHKSKNIHTLIDINHLLKDTIEEKDDTLILGARVNLQQIIEHFKSKQISHCAKHSCYSKNIRNQRTVGGEVAQQRTTSELNVFFFAINATLNVFTEGEIRDISIRDWDGKGIVVSITCPSRNVDVHRYSLLPSAPAFVIVGIDIEEKNCAVGGRCKKIGICDISEMKQQKIDVVVDDIFVDDHHGSIDYKKHLIAVSLKSN